MIPSSSALGLLHCVILKADYFDSLPWTNLLICANFKSVYMDIHKFWRVLADKGTCVAQIPAMFLTFVKTFGILLLWLYATYLL